MENERKDGGKKRKEGGKKTINEKPNSRGESSGTENWEL